MTLVATFEQAGQHLTSIPLYKHGFFFFSCVLLEPQRAEICKSYGGAGCSQGMAHGQLARRALGDAGIAMTLGHLESVWFLTGAWVFISTSLIPTPFQKYGRALLSHSKCWEARCSSQGKAGSREEGRGPPPASFTWQWPLGLPLALGAVLGATCLLTGTSEDAPETYPAPDSGTMTAQGGSSQERSRS